MRSITIILIFLWSNVTLVGQAYCYYETNRGISITDYELENFKTLIPSTFQAAGDLTWDETNQIMFSSAGEHLKMYDNDGDPLSTISLRSFEDINGYALDPLRRRVFILVADRWIMSMNYEGQERDTLYAGEVDYYGGFGFNPVDNALYMVEGESENWRYIRFDIETQDFDNILFSDQDARSFQYDYNSNSLYYSDVEDDRIEYYNLNEIQFTPFTLFDYSQYSTYLFNFHIDSENQKLLFYSHTQENLYAWDMVLDEVQNLGYFNNSIDQYTSSSDGVYFNVYDYYNRGVFKYNYETQSIENYQTARDGVGFFAVDNKNERLFSTSRFGSIYSYDLQGNIIEQHKGYGISNVDDMIFINDKYYLNDGRLLFEVDAQFENRKFLTGLTDLRSDKMAYNPDDNKLYISKRWDNEIYSVNLDGTDYQRIFYFEPGEDDGEFGFTDIAYSKVTKKLYLTCWGDHLLVSINPDGTDLEILYEGDFNDDFYTPTFDPTGRYLYFQASDIDVLYRLDVSTGQRDIVSTETGFGSLCFDDQGNLLAVDYGDDIIYLLDTDGKTAIFSDENIQMGGDLIYREGKLICSIWNSSKALLEIDISSGQYEEHIHLDQSISSPMFYDEETDLLWGYLFASSNPNTLFSLNPATGDIDYYDQTRSYFDAVIVPSKNSLYYKEDSISILGENTIIRHNYISGQKDTILPLIGDFDYYRDLLYVPSRNRIYISASSDEPLLSMNLDGEDVRTEEADETFITFMCDNPIDGLITLPDNTPTKRIRRWDPETGEITYHGTDQDYITSFNWDVIHSFYNELDADNDGYTFIEDCDDTQAGINPGATEIPDNDIDENCDGIIEITDEDGDGIGILHDCDDTNPDINPYAEEIPNNDIDENCDGVIEVQDDDNDGFNSDEDCDDTNPNINPDAEEIPNNNIDENCDGVLEGTDADGDGYWITEDCDDTNPDINPGAPEIVYNGIDDDCNETTPDDDLDGDGFNMDEDCDDLNALINPSMDEIPYNDIDDDCNENTPDDDLDGDGFTMDEDCDDLNAEVNPSIEELPYNGIDDDCNENTPDDDLDGDGFTMDEDCDDMNENINPDAEEIANNDIDEDCDGEILVSSVVNWAEGKIVLYPNPTLDFLYIEYTDIDIQSIELVDMKGMFISSLQRAKNDISELPAGMYLVRLIRSDGDVKYINIVVE